MRFCTNCGSQVPETSKFCTECGEKLAQAAAPPAPVAEVPAQPVFATPTPPAEIEERPAYTPPVQDDEPVYEEPRPVSPPPGEAAERAAPAKEKKPVNKKFFLFGGILVAVILIIVILAAALGGGADADNPVLGLYNAASCESMGMSLDCEGEWIELKSGGNADIFLMDESYSGKWSLEGEKFILTQAGDEFSGTLKDKVLTLDFGGLVYTYEKEGFTAPTLPVEPAEPIEPAEPAEPAEPVEQPLESEYEWWNGDWYGWWIVYSGSGAYESWEEYYWDAYAEIEVFDDDSGRMIMWDPDTAYDSPLASMEVYFGPGVSKHGTMRVESGYFMDYEFRHADWSADPGAMGFDIEDMIWIDFEYVDPANPDDTMDIYIFLRPWGTYWDDVYGQSGENWPYDDMMPMYYNEWYKPLIDRGYELPDSYVEGLEILNGGVSDGEVLASDQWDDCRIDVVGAEHFVDCDGRDAIRVYYDFTNTGSDSVCAADYVIFEVSQDDYKQISTYPSWDEIAPEDGNNFLCLRPGVSIRCVAEYPLKLTGGNLVMEFENYWNENQGFTVEFDPQNLPGRPSPREEEFVSSPAWLNGVPESGDVGNITVSIDHVDIVEGYEFEDVFKVVLYFTNNSDEATHLGWEAECRAFQNGIELEDSYPSTEAETDADRRLYEDVLSGQTAQVAVCFDLRNEQSPIEFEVFDYWSGEKIGKVFELTWGG